MLAKFADSHIIRLREASRGVGCTRQASSGEKMSKVRFYSLRSRIALPICATLFGIAFTCRPASAGYHEVELYTIGPMNSSSGPRVQLPRNPSFENVFNPGT